MLRVEQLSHSRALYPHLLISSEARDLTLPAVSRDSGNLAGTLISLQFVTCPTMTQIAGKAQELRFPKSCAQGYGQVIHRKCGYPLALAEPVTSRPLFQTTILKYWPLSTNRGRKEGEGKYALVSDKECVTQKQCRQFASNSCQMLRNMFWMTFHVFCEDNFFITLARCRPFDRNTACKA